MPQRECHFPEAKLVNSKCHYDLRKNSSSVLLTNSNDQSSGLADQEQSMITRVN